MAGEAAGAERGEGALVRKAGERVALVHELGELAGAEELLDGRHDRADVDERLRGDLVDVLRAHALTDDALHTAHADTELVRNELAHGADAAVAKVVDVVEALGGVTGVEGQQVAQGLDDVLLREHAGGGLEVEAELLVDLVAADASEVVALLVEVEAVDERAGGVHGGGLAGALATVDLKQGVLAGGGGVALERVAHDVGVAEEREDLVVRLGDAEGAQEHRRGLAALAVDGDHEVAALVDLELKPRAAGGDELRLVDAHAVVHLGGEVHARGADELGDHDALGAVDHEGAALGHEREVAHEDELLLHLAGLLVDEAHVNEEGGLVGDVLRAALGDGVRRVAELVVTKGDLQGVRGVLDRGELGEGLGKPLPHEPLEGLLLNGDEVRQLHRRGDLAKGLASGRSLWFGKSSLCGRHQAFPPSKRVEGGNCRNVISYRNHLAWSMKSLDLATVFE